MIVFWRLLFTSLANDNIMFVCAHFKIQLATSAVLYMSRTRQTVEITDNY